MILSMAHASVEDPSAEYIFGAWSDIVVGERPDGLIDCYLSRGDGVVHMVSIWTSIEDHDRAMVEAKNHPPLHSDRYDFTDAALEVGMRMFVSLVTNFRA